MKTVLLEGIRQDLRTRGPKYLEDFRDGLHLKSVSSTLFLYFACLAPAITFGGIMGLYTGSQMGAIEMLIATAIVGIVWALISGQPLIIMGGTGPMLVFTGILYQLCGHLNLAFLPTYLWVGIWTAVLIIIMGVFNVSNVIGYFTRFTDEIFAALISIIFIYESVSSLLKIFWEGYSHSQPNHDVPLLSIVLAIGTFQIAMVLARFRKSHFLLPAIREFLADFGPAIAIIAMTVAYIFLKNLEPINLAELKVPDQIVPSAMDSDGSPRSWIVNAFDVPAWVPFAAIFPAILAVILVFLDQNITARLVNSPDHRLEKGTSYHWDLIVLGVLTALCSVLGLPWLVAATVRSINHVKSLATYEENNKISKVCENRVTPLAIHLLIGASLFFLPLLKQIPMAVLYGIFLYMGIVSIGGNQFFERLSLWIMDSKLYPTTHYLRRVPLREIHKFTGIQAFALALLWVIKTSFLGILFPIFIFLLVPLRFYLNRHFNQEHLDALDAEEMPDEEDLHWSY